MSVKGSWSRVRDAKKFAENYGKIFQRKGAKKQSRREAKIKEHQHENES